MQLSKQQKWMATGVAITISATFLIFSSFNGIAQKSTKINSAAPNEDSATTKRKSLRVDSRIQHNGLMNDGLEKSMAALEKAMTQLDKQQLGKISETIESALQGIDFKKIQFDVEQALKTVDMAAIEQDVKNAFKSIDKENIQLDIKKAMKEIDVAKIQAEIIQSLNEVNWKAISQEVEAAMKDAKISLQEAKKMNIENLKMEVENAKEAIAASKTMYKDEMRKAKVEMEKAKERLKSTTKMLIEMEQDGLIKNDEPLNIEWKGDLLLINGKVQPQNVIDKYKKYQSQENKTPQ